MTHQPNRIAGTSDGAFPHYHLDGELCQAFHPVEPIYRDENALRGHRPIEELVSQHDEHGTEEARTAMALMATLGISCEQVGVHSHPMMVDVASKPGTYRQKSTPHHHHDLRCLVEVGANPVRKDLRVEQERSDKWHRRFDGQRAINERLRVREATLEAELKQRREEMARMLIFMANVPAKGPWTTVHEQYSAWVKEQAEEAAEAERGEG